MLLALASAQSAPFVLRSGEMMASRMDLASPDWEPSAAQLPASTRDGSDLVFGSQPVFVASVEQLRAAAAPPEVDAVLLNDDAWGAARRLSIDVVGVPSLDGSTGRFHPPMLRAVLADRDPIDNVKISAATPVERPSAALDDVARGGAEDPPATAPVSLWLAPSVPVIVLVAWWLFKRPRARRTGRPRSAPA